MITLSYEDAPAATFPVAWVPEPLDVFHGRGCRCWVTVPGGPKRARSWVV